MRTGYTTGKQYGGDNDEDEDEDEDEDDSGLQIEFGNDHGGAKRFSWEGMIRRGGAHPVPGGVGSGASASAQNRGSSASVASSRVANEFFGGAAATEEERQKLHGHIGAVAAGHADRVQLSRS